MKKVLEPLGSLICALIAATSLKMLWSGVLTPQHIANKSFTAWCEQKESLPTETKKTIDVLLEKAETTDCQEADFKLSNLTILDLSNSEISDLQPLTGLKNLEGIMLNENKIIDLKPLEELGNLQLLDLSNNQISDLKPLTTLSHLELLLLNSNKISDIQPLAKITNLYGVTFSDIAVPYRVQCIVHPE
jgi:internalin A